MRNTHSLRASVEVAGNLLSAFSHLTGAKKNDDGYYELFGTEYAQYVKLDFDFSKGIVLDSRNKLAFQHDFFRSSIGGYPLGFELGISNETFLEV